LRYLNVDSPKSMSLKREIQKKISQFNLEEMEKKNIHPRELTMEFRITTLIYVKMMI